ncbi:MAG: amidohydrolase [Dorea sp.]|nr:amidohydrolase [Dorea sp.]
MVIVKMMDWVKEAEKLKEQIIADRRYLHEHAEFGMELPGTIKYVKSRLQDMGYKPEDCGGGVTAVIGHGERTILIRADMDALKVEEDNNLSFRSRTGISHMCGHDLHTAILLGTAALLKKNEEQLEGTVKLMFQPGEEVALGAKAMMAAGVLENPKVEAALSLHVMSHIRNGVMTYKTDAAFSSFDGFKIHIEGKGAHGSAPEYAVDPIYAGVQVYQAIQGVVARETSMFHSAVCSIGHFEGGKMGNIIPEYAVLEGTLRCYDEEDRKKILDRIAKVLEGVEKASGTSITMTFTSMPVLKNDEELCRMLAPVFADIPGLEFYEEAFPINASEDFGYIAQVIPTMYLLFGAGDPGMPVNHSAKAVFQESKLHLASAAFADAAEQWFRRKNNDFNKLQTDTAVIIRNRSTVREH